MVRAIVWVTVALSTTACASREWRRAQDLNTGEAYRSFVAARPESSRVELAMRRAEDLDWVAARAADTASAYRAYLGAHPQGAHAPQAREKAASLSLAAAELEGTPEALTTFLVEFPGDPRKAEIEDRIEGLWHERAVREGTDEAWGSYLVRYPSGRWAGDARTARDEAAWTRTVTEDTRGAYERYVNRFDDGRHRLDALDWLARLRVSRIQPVIALGKAPGTPEQRRALTYDLRKTMDASLGRELKRDFEVMRTIMVDLRGSEPPHPQDAYGAAADTGLLVVVYNEKRGVELEPSGFATDIEARVELYCPPSRKPVVTTEVTATTQLPVTGIEESVLHDSAVDDFADQLLSVADAVAIVRRETLP
ncbi:MAG: hypothetical protein AAF602_11435 [Myxococcota bacterium]